MPLVNSGLNHHMVARHDPDTYHLSCGDFVWTLDVLEIEFELDERMVIMETSILALFSCILGFIISVPINTWFTYVGFVLPEPVDIGGIMASHMQGVLTFKVFALPTLVVVASAITVSIPPSIRAARITPAEALASH